MRGSRLELLLLLFLYILTWIEEKLVNRSRKVGAISGGGKKRRKKKREEGRSISMMKAASEKKQRKSLKT